MIQTVAITGNTFPVKDQLKALGGRWNSEQKAWMVPAGTANEARNLVSGAPSAPKTNSKPCFSKCHECKAPSRGYYRCYQCSIDYREGGGMHAGGMSYRNSHGQFVLGDDD